MTPRLRSIGPFAALFSVLAIPACGGDVSPAGSTRALPLTVPPCSAVVPPTLMRSRGMLARSRSPGFWPSSSHNAATPSTLCVLIVRRTCGFAQRTFVTSPRASTNVELSYSAVE